VYVLPLRNNICGLGGGKTIIGFTENFSEVSISDFKRSRIKILPFPASLAKLIKQESELGL
jgi:hypothetical protein